MRPTSILIAGILLIAVISISTPEEDAAGSKVTRKIAFVDVGPSAFDEQSAPTFISAADWNNDGYVDLLFNGYRLFKNNGPPGWNFTRMPNIFNSTTSGAKNGVWADWDGDGDRDLYQGCGKNTADRFWDNQGAPNFDLVDVSDAVFGRWENLGPNTGNAWGDLDLDGDLDIYVGNGEDWNDGNPVNYPDFFLRNEGGTSFTDVSSSVGIRTGEDFYSRGVTWGDFNNDARNDAYVSHYRIRENHLFTNQGDGTFEEEGMERNCSGTYDPTWYYDNRMGRYYGPMWGHTIGSSWADFNRDGDLDLWTSDFVHKYVGPYGTSSYDIRGYICDDGNLYINDGAPYYTFTDLRNTSGIPIWPIGGSGVYQGDQTFSGVTVGDYDNDGWEDMYIPQVYGDLPYTTPHLFRNKGFTADPNLEDGTTFEDVTNSLGIEGANTYACLFVDYDSDGDLDLVTGGGETWDGSKWEDYRVRLYKNQGTGDNHWIEIGLNDTGMNPEGIGARVVLRYNMSGEQYLITREVRAGTGQAHQESTILHFGLGDLPLSDSFEFHRLEVRWPDGTVQYERDVDLNTISTVQRRGEFTPALSGWGTSTPIEEDRPLEVFVSFQGTGPTITGYDWDLDSDNIFDRHTSAHNITLAFHQSGLYHIRCRVLGENGLARDVYPIAIEVPNRPPMIDLEGTSVDMDSPLFLPEDVIVDTPSDLANISWTVDWGDGVSEEGTGPALPSHIYKEPGAYYLTIEAFDESESTSHTVEIDVVNVDPTGSIRVTGGEEGPHYEDDLIEFQPLVVDTPSDTGDMSMRWDFGDGTEGAWSALGTARHRYSENGRFFLNVSVRDQYGGIGVLEGWVDVKNRDPILVPGDAHSPVLYADEDEYLEMKDLFEGMDSDSDISTLEYRWDFGDGNTSEWRSSPDTSHVYEMQGIYTAQLRVEDDDGITADSELEIRVENVKPWIISVTGTYDLFEDDEMNFGIEAGDTPSDIPLLQYHLDTGDGRVLSGRGQFTFSYPRSGIYEMRAWVTDDDGEPSHEESVFVTVLNRPPSGSILSSTTTLDEDETLELEAVELSDSSADLEVLTIRWDLDDGSEMVEGPELDHVYRRKGVYDVRMLIYDGDDTTIETLKVTVNNPAPTAVMMVSNDTVEVGVNITFSATGSYDNPSDIPTLIFYWDFGDDTTGAGIEVFHSYASPGEYMVTLEVKDDDGSFSTAQAVVNVTGPEPGTNDNRDADGGSETLLIVLLISVLILVFAFILLTALVISKGRKDARMKVSFSSFDGISLPPYGGRTPPIHQGMVRPQLTQKKGEPTHQAHGPPYEIPHPATEMPPVPPAPSSPSTGPR